MDVDDIIMVLRAFPIRVGGNSGRLPNEIDWPTLSLESGSPDKLVEYTSVTKTLRRVGRFDAAVVQQAITSNRPSRLVLNHLDYVDWSCRSSDAPSTRTHRFVSEIETLINKRIDYFGFGPASLFDRNRIDELK